MSEIKVNNVTPRVACGTTQLGDSGDTITIPSGATITNLGTATGFGGTGVVSWDTSSIKTAGFTAVTGTGYFCNTTGGTFTVTLPLSPSAGDVVGVADYAQTFDTDKLTLGRNSSNIGGVAEDAVLETEGIAVTLVYVDGTKGWIVTDSGLQSDAPGPTYVVATGGCITTCGNFKMHTFNNPNTFCVSAVGNDAGSNTVSYIVVAGGGGTDRGNPGGRGGGGAGGFRESKASTDCYTASPLNATSGPGYNLPVSVSPYAITIGGGGAGSPAPGGSCVGTSGSDTTFSTITSTGGGGALSAGSPSGGSGGGGPTIPGPGQSPPQKGCGNTPPTTPPQGNDGGLGLSTCGPGSPFVYRGGGGGGATAAGADASPSLAGPGGTGATTCISANPVAYAGGGGGGAGREPSGTLVPAGAAGAGGGGAGGARANGTDGGCNTGGGGGGAGYCGGAGGYSGAAGGSGIVIIRYRYQ